MAAVPVDCTMRHCYSMCMQVTQLNIMSLIESFCMTLDH